MTSETSVDLPADSVIGHYRIVSKIGAGGMGEVFLAEDTKLERQVAIKVLPEEIAADTVRIQRFVGEARAASALSHPNILTIYEIGETDGRRFMVTEYVKGQTLGDFLEHEHPPIPEILNIAVQIASALEAAHAAGIVHRDIKPDNIMVRRDGIIKLLDFGLAKQRASENSEIDHEGKTKLLAKTQAGMIMGTVGYMSPEQARGRETDAQTDIWSFGCVLYEMLTGKQPFHGDTVTDVLANIIHREPDSIRLHRKDVPAEIERIVSKAISKSKDERYAATSDLYAELKQLQTRMLVDAELGRTREMESTDFAESLPKVNSIAVLPFADIGSEEDNKYFADGLTEEIIASLSKLQTLKVISQSSTMRYVKEGKSHKQAADDLGAQYLLEGSVRRHGNNLRITAHLVDTNRDTYIWAETYRGTIEDIFDIQEKVAAEIVRALQLRLSPDEAENLKKRYTQNTEAYQLYLQGRFFWNKRTEDGIKTAIRYFEQAIKIDGQYALAWAGVADSYALLGEYGKISRKKLYPKAELAVSKALEIDNSLAEGHTSLASLLMLNKWDWAGAEKEFKIALELNPNYATAYHWYSQLVLNRGKFEEAIAMISRAAELDPISQGILKDKGITLYYSRCYDDAIEIAGKALEIDPNFGPSYRLLSLAYQGKGMFDEAVVENKRWSDLTGNKVEFTFSLAQLYAVMGRRDEALELAVVAEKDRSKSDQGNRGLALIYACLGENDKAFNWLEKGYARREESMLSLKVDPKVDSIRSDPRYSLLLRKIGLEG